MPAAGISRWVDATVACEWGVQVPCPCVDVAGALSRACVYVALLECLVRGSADGAVQRVQGRMVHDQLTTVARYPLDLGRKCSARRG